MPVVNVHILQLLIHTGQLGDDGLQRTHLFYLTELLQKIVVIELILQNLLGCRLGFFFVQFALGIFNEGQHVAHAQNTACHSVRMEYFQVVQFFAHTHKLNGLAGNCPNGQRRTASGVTVQLGEDHTANGQQIVKGLCHVDGFLTGHRVNHQENLMGVYLFVDALQLVHQGFVNLQPAGGINDNDVMTVVFRITNGILTNLYRIVLALLKHRHTCLRTHNLQLLDRSRTVNITGNQHRAVSLPFVELCQLCGMGGFTCTLQATHHNNGWRLCGKLDTLLLAAHEIGQLLVYDLNDHLTGGKACHYVRTDCTLCYTVGKVFGNLIVYVRLQ